DIAAMMSARGRSCVVVCEGARAVGLISERDLVRVLGSVLAGATVGKAAELMSHPVVTIPSGVSTEDASERMTSHRIRRLVVVDDEGEALGIITQSDMVRAHLDAISRHQQLLETRVASRTAELEAANQQLETMSRIDPLMNIGNRRAMEEAMAMAHQRATRYGRTYSVILLDIDHFKAYNNTYGHPRGDRVLRDVGREISDSVRMLDTVYRYGGEEVLVLLPETAEEGTRAVAERILRSVQALAIEHKSSSFGIVTISAGLATAMPGADGVVPGNLQLLDAADQSLYQAKGQGRNRLGQLMYPD
ncbi:MAG: diguanylate cyclase, partial [Gammaproteobacteria bacterium]|nr:diguanylate cyclase [Gammaproteobacteria bacterium]